MTRVCLAQVAGLFVLTERAIIMGSISESAPKVRALAHLITCAASFVIVPRASRKYTAVSNRLSDATVDRYASVKRSRA